MTNFQSAQRQIDRTTLEFRILQLLQRFQVRRDPESNDVIYVNTGIKFDISFIARQLGRIEETNRGPTGLEVLAALTILVNHKEDGVKCPLVFRQKSNWIISMQGVQYFGESVRNIWHNTTQSVAAHRNEALMGAKENNFGQWVPTELTNAALTSPNPPSSQDADGAMIDTVEKMSRIRSAARELNTTPHEAELAITGGTARKCPLCGRLKWLEAFYKNGNARRTICKDCQKRERNDIQRDT